MTYPTYAQKTSISFLPEKQTLTPNEWLDIKGLTLGIPEGVSVIMTIMDSKENFLVSTKLLVDRFGEFQFITQLTEKEWKEGRYVIKVEYENHRAFGVFEIRPSVQIPDWIKRLAEFWTTNEITDSEFVEAIQFLIVREIIVVPIDKFGTEGEPSEIPSWIKITTGFWVDDKTSDQEFALAIQYLIGEGIIKIPPPKLKGL